MEVIIYSSKYFRRTSFVYIKDFKYELYLINKWICTHWVGDGTPAQPRRTTGSSCTKARARPVRTPHLRCYPGGGRPNGTEIPPPRWDCRVSWRRYSFCQRGMKTGTTSPLVPSYLWDPLCPLS